MKIKVSAPGKIHLIGEHSAVYGYPALLAAIDKRLSVELEVINKSDTHGHEFHKDVHKGVDLIKYCMETFKKKTGVKTLPAFHISVHSDIPIGSGLGSSASLSASLIGALFKITKNIWNPVKINEISYEVEKYQHKNPSGGDNTVITFGGLLWYRKEVEFLKSIFTLPSSSYHLPKLVLINTGIPDETTGEMVKKVEENYKKDTKKYDDLFKNQEYLTKELLVSLRKDNKDEVFAIWKKAERNLENMGVVGERTKELIREIEKEGGAAKITGAGGVKSGSGMIICHHKDLSRIEKVAKEKSLEFIRVSLGEEGIRIESMEGIGSFHE